MGNRINHINEFSELLTKPVPVIKKQAKTFMEIAGYPHYENVVSNILQFFLTPNEEHNLGMLFLNSLIDCYNDKAEIKINLPKASYYVERESPALYQTRMDLLVTSDDDEESSGAFALIIECKIWATLYNNLDYYWDALKQKNKAGIVLSLYPEKSITHKGFLNITFEELTNQILKNFGSYLIHGTERHIIFLKEFLSNLSTLKSANIMKEQFDFYYQFMEKINELASIRDNVFNSIIKGLHQAGQQAGYQITNTRAYSYRCWVSELSDDIYYNFLVDNYNKYNSTLTIRVEISNNIFSAESAIINDETIIKFIKEYDFITKSEAGSQEYKFIMHKEIILDANIVAGLTEYLLDFDRKCLSPLIKRAVEVIKNHQK